MNQEGRNANVDWPTFRRLIFGMFAAPVAFAVQLSSSYALVPWACSRSGGSIVLHLIAVAAVALAFAGMLVSRSQLRALNQLEGNVHVERQRFMATWGVLGSGFFLLVTLALEVPNLLLGPCAI